MSIGIEGSHMRQVRHISTRSGISVEAARRMRRVTHIGPMAANDGNVSKLPANLALWFGMGVKGVGGGVIFPRRSEGFSWWLSKKSKLGRMNGRKGERLGISG